MKTRTLRVEKFRGVPMRVDIFRLNVQVVNEEDAEEVHQ
jgi:hypothetical protein